MFDVKSAVGKSFVINILLTIFSIACIAQDLSECRFRELFEEGLKKCYRYRNPYGGISDAVDDNPFQGDSNSVPFLVDVLNNGPIWLSERKYSCHLARCYATVCLGATRDPSALTPLIGELRKVDEPENVADVAAIALGLLGDTRAVDPLIAALQDDRLRQASATALGKIGDVRASAKGTQGSTQKCDAGRVASRP